MHTLLRHTGEGDRVKMKLFDAGGRAQLLYKPIFSAHCTFTNGLCLFDIDDGSLLTLSGVV